MPADAVLAARVRALLDGAPGLEEKKMFGGIGWILHGNMAVGAHSGGGLLVRCDKDDWERWCGEEGAGPMIHGGRSSPGWLVVDGAQVADDAALVRWVERGRAYAASLPPK